MTNYREDWNLYVVNFLMKETIKDDHENFLSESYYISVELFRFKNPEEAYNLVQQMVENNGLSYVYRNEKGNTIELECIGLNDLDLLQTNPQQMKNDLEAGYEYGFDITTINLNNIQNPIDSFLTKSKSDLKLFMD